jgi:trk system potassium uptake protein TrkA
VVARVYDSRRAEVFQRLGIPTVPTVPWTIDHVLRRILPERAVTEWSDATGHLHLIERPLPAAWAGCPLPAAAVHGDGIRVVAVTRAGLPTVDIGDLVGQEGDVLHLVVTHDVEGKLEALFPGASGVSVSSSGGDHG